MSSRTASPPIDLAPNAAARPRLALALALLSVPGVLLTWELVPGGGFVSGVPLAVAALVLATQARNRLAGVSSTRMATIAAVIATLALAVVAICMVAYAVA